MKTLIISAAVKLAGGAEGIIKYLGGVEGLVELALKWFNEKVLAKITDKAEFAAYATDVALFGDYLNGVFTRHEKWMSAEKRAALKATIDAVNTLADALKDCNISKEEVDKLIDAVVAAIKAWREAK